MSNKAFHVPSVQAHRLESKEIGQAFQIQVMQPLMKKGAQERFPVLYLTDANLAFDFAKGISHCLQVAGQVRRFILVGIGYPGDNPFAGNVLRCRDLTSDRRPEIPGLPMQSPIEGVSGVSEGERHWSGASAFLSFVRDEIVPFIDRSYPTIPGERAYFGHSLGGGFGLHALFTQPDLFKAYAISSPGISYDGDDYGIREAEDFIESAKPLNARIFMTVGELEEFDADVAKSRFVSSFYRLAALLRRAQIPGLDLQARVIAGETHVSVWPIAFSHGVQAIYGPEPRSPLA